MGEKIHTMHKTGINAAYFDGHAESIRHERIMEIQDKYPGLEYMHVRCNRKGVEIEVMIEQLERFGKEVMPKFNVEKRI